MADPYAVLGVSPGDPPEVVHAAWRERAKRLHPDIAGSDPAHPAAAAQMAEVNAAYDEVRALESAARGGLGPGVAPAPPSAAPSRPRTRAGAWLSESTRRALGRELLAALEPSEPVRLVADVSTWASPSARLALTDRRLLWLLDDAVTHRVRTLRFRDVDRVEHRLQWPRRRRARLRLHTTAGRRVDFGDLAPATATQIAGTVSHAPR